jgi:hypothetical protein
MDNTKTDTLRAYVGTDPDAQVNVFHYDKALVKYTITKELFNTEYPCQQGPAGWTIPSNRNQV